MRRPSEFTGAEFLFLTTLANHACSPQNLWKGRPLFMCGLDKAQPRAAWLLLIICPCCNTHDLSLQSLGVFIFEGFRLRVDWRQKGGTLWKLFFPSSRSQMTEQKTQKTLIYCSLFLQAGQGSGFPLSLLLAGDQQFIFLQAIHQGREASEKAKQNRHHEGGQDHPPSD